MFTSCSAVTDLEDSSWSRDSGAAQVRRPPGLNHSISTAPYKDGRHGEFGMTQRFSYSGPKRLGGFRCGTPDSPSGCVAGSSSSSSFSALSLSSVVVPLRVGCHSPPHLRPGRSSVTSLGPASLVGTHRVWFGHNHSGSSVVACCNVW